MNADFHDEISAEEKAKTREQAKIDAVRKAEAIESALIGSKSVEGLWCRPGVKYDHIWRSTHSESTGKKIAE